MKIIHWVRECRRVYTHFLSVEPSKGRPGSHRQISHDVSSQTRSSECWEKILEKNPFQLSQRALESQLK